MLIEHYADDMPLRPARRKVVVATITSDASSIGKGVNTLPKTTRPPHATRVYPAAAVF